MNINVNKCDHRDPFEGSDRVASGAGKGDRDRSNLQLFKANFPPSMGPKVRLPGKRTYYYGS